jgi:4-hydroxy-tetrahydrodipicolinate reductase
MRILVLGVGKTGKLVAEVAAEHGHSVHVLDAKENKDAAALTAPFVAGFDVVIDFTTPDAVVSNMRACLANGAKMVIGTTGWYDKLPDMKALADRRGGSLLYGTNFSIGVQIMLNLTQQMASALKNAGYTFSIAETHHESKLDAPSGTALTLRDTILSACGVEEEVLIQPSRTSLPRASPSPKAPSAPPSGSPPPAPAATTSAKSSTSSSRAARFGRILLA